MGLSFDFRSCAESERERLESLVACFQAFVGHELPNALVGLQGLARLLATESGMPEEARGLLDRLAALARKTDLCSRRLAEIGRLLRGPTFGPPVELTEAIREAAAETNTRHLGSPLELTMPHSLPTLPLARPLLHAVLVQLFANAAGAGTSGRPCLIQITTTTDDGGVWLTVSDGGRGMSETQLAQLGEPFAAGRQPGATGTGLGFFLVRQAAAKWGGAVRVGSVPGSGTTVSVFFPLSEKMRDEG